MRWLAVVVVCVIAAATAHADDWGARRNPFDPQIVRRYKAILEKDPHDEAALRHLVELYQRYRTVAKLEAEYEAEAREGTPWAVFVVLARLPRKSHPTTIEWWLRATIAKPDDARAWLALGDAWTSEPAGAVDAYKRAAGLFRGPEKRKLALTKLVSAARVANDAVTVDAAYVELIQISPKDGTLWLDRGNAQLAVKQYAAALASFAAAEPLLATDPERQLSAITNHAVALEALGRVDEAIAEYERALDKSPSYLGREIVLRLIDADRKRAQLPAAIARLEKRWPERARGYFEWATLGDLYHELHDDEHALAAYRLAVTRAPTEVTTQRKLIALLDQLHPEQALAQHEAAARVAPGDPDLQIALAKRYYADQQDKAFKTLDALARRFNQNVSVLGAIAGLYEQWNETKRAIAIYEVMVAAEPTEPDHAIVLGEAYFRDGDTPKARAAWDKLDKIGTAVALFRHGEVLLLHELFDDAVVAYGKALALDGTNADAWYGRARAFNELAKFPQAIDDARRAVALTAYATQVEGLRNRGLYMRVLGRANDRAGLEAQIAKWRFAFDRGDAAAGYLLAAHHARISSHQLHDVLVQLYKLEPKDDSLGIALARSFVHRREFDRARAELDAIVKRGTTRPEDMQKLIAQVDEDRARAEQQIRWEEEGRSGPSSVSPDLVARERYGMRLWLGTDVYAARGAVLGIGGYHVSRLENGLAFQYRIDWQQRSEPMAEVDEFAVSLGIVKRIIDARKLEVAIGGGPRFAVRYGSDAWNRVALAADAMLEVLPRAVPATVGVRFDQNLTDDAKSSAVFLELGFEAR